MSRIYLYKGSICGKSLPSYLPHGFTLCLTPGCDLVNPFHTLQALLHIGRAQTHKQATDYNRTQSHLDLEAVESKFVKLVASSNPSA